jgi:hypothetical protein
VLPAAASLQKQGANKGATTAFLISTPESGVDSIAVTYALLDPIMTVVRPVAAFFTAVTAGLVENILDWKNVSISPEKSNDNSHENCDKGHNEHSVPAIGHQSFLHKINAGFRYAVTDVWGDIALWYYIGIGVAACIMVVVPDALMTSLLGGGVGSMFIMLLIGVPLYICATASTPVAAALIVKGVSPGAALVFLLVGPATNVTSLSVLFKLLGKKSTFRYLTVLSLSAVFFGLAVDQIYAFLHISPTAVIGEAAEIIPHPVKIIAALALLLFSIKPIWSQLRKRFVPKHHGSSFEAGFPKF